MSAADFDYDGIFNDDYLYFFGERLARASGADADLIWRLLALEAGTTVLDLACGHGRIANRLAALGARVTGLDVTPLFVEQARAEASAAQLKVDYVEGDMRELPWPDESFDRVVSWFTSFGYFSDEENRGVLREARRVLRPGGRLLIENNNLAEVLPRWLPSVVVERGDDFVVDRVEFDPVTSRARTERIVVRDGQPRRSVFSVRMFLAPELKQWLLAAGFDAVEFIDRQGEPLTARSPRMVTVARTDR